ncbi:MAG: sigma-54-dependent Fis family transcriptional regulator [Bacillota bacterium]
MLKPWEGRSDQVDLVQAAWLAFLRGGQPGAAVRSPILHSWQRSLAAGVNPGQPGGRNVLDPGALTEARARHNELLNAAAPLLQQSRQLLAGTGQVLVVCDPQARALVVEGEPSASLAAEEIGLLPGADWSEAGSGTNAMGMSAFEQGPVTVYAAEHFLEDLHPWACVAAPVRCPVTGSVLGVIDLSGIHMSVTHHTFMAVLGAVQTVEARLAQMESNYRAALLEARLERQSHLRSAAIAVLDRRGRLLQAPESLAHAPSDRWAEAMVRLQRTGAEFETETVDLHGRPLYLRIHPVRLHGQIIGALVESGGAARGSISLSRAGAEPALPGLVGRNPAWLATLERAARAARTESTVILSGETGTGKEVLARAIHRASRRAAGPFIPVNCGALPPNLASSELFGYVGGAFTGANPRGSAGKVEAAHGGTLFLDEVSELPPEAQVALLRVLQEREVVRVGSHRAIAVDVRVVAATNRDLQVLVDRGEFRADLFYRLNVVPLRLPALRERREDILPLIEYAYRRLGEEPPELPFGSWDRLTAHAWPGNVRELLNLVEQAVALHEDPASLLPLPPLDSDPAGVLGESGEEEQIREALASCGGNAAAAARALGMSRSTLYRKLELYDIRLKRQVQ